MKEVLLGSDDGDHVRIHLHERGFDREGWMHCPVSIRADGFEGRIQAYFESADFERFAGDLAQLSANLTGDVRLEPAEGQLTIRLVGNGRGAISVTGNAFSKATYGTRLEFEIEIDQTFLDRPLRELREFLAQLPTRP